MGFVFFSFGCGMGGHWPTGHCDAVPGKYTKDILAACDHSRSRTARLHASDRVKSAFTESSAGAGDVLDSFERIFRARTCDAVIWTEAAILLEDLAEVSREAQSMATRLLLDRGVNPACRFAIERGLRRMWSIRDVSPGLVEAYQRVLSDMDDDKELRKAVAETVGTTSVNAVALSEVLVSVSIAPNEDRFLRGIALRSLIRRANRLTPSQHALVVSSAESETDAGLRQYLEEVARNLAPGDGGAR